MENRRIDGRNAVRGGVPGQQLTRCHSRKAEEIDGNYRGAQGK